MVKFLKQALFILSCILRYLKVKIIENRFIDVTKNEHIGCAYLNLIDYECRNYFINCVNKIKATHLYQQDRIPLQEIKALLGESKRRGLFFNSREISRANLETRFHGKTIAIDHDYGQTNIYIFDRCIHNLDCILKAIWLYGRNATLINDSISNHTRLRITSIAPLQWGDAMVITTRLEGEDAGEIRRRRQIEAIENENRRISNMLAPSTDTMLQYRHPASINYHPINQFPWIDSVWETRTSPISSTSQLEEAASTYLSRMSRRSNKQKRKPNVGKKTGKEMFKQID